MSGLAGYYARQERELSNAIKRGSLVLSDELDEDAGLSLASDKAEIAAIKSIAGGLTKSVTDQLKAIGKAKDVSSIRSAVEEANAAISKQLKRLKAYSENLEGEDDDLDSSDDTDVETEKPRLKAKPKGKTSVKPTGKAAKAVAASHGKRRSLRLSDDKDEEAFLDLYNEVDLAIDEANTTWEKYKKQAADAKDEAALRTVLKNIAALGKRLSAWK